MDPDNRESRNIALLGAASVVLAASAAATQAAGTAPLVRALLRRDSDAARALAASDTVQGAVGTFALPLVVGALVARRRLAGALRVVATGSALAAALLAAGTRTTAIAAAGIAPLLVVVATIRGAVGGSMGWHLARQAYVVAAAMAARKNVPRTLALIAGIVLAGWTLGPLAGALVAAYWGPQGVLVGAAAGSAIAALLVFQVCDPPSTDAAKAHGATESCTSPSSVLPLASLLPSWHRWESRHTCVILLLVYRVLAETAAALWGNTLFLYAGNRYGWTAQESGMYYAARGAASALSLLVLSAGLRGVVHRLAQHMFPLSASAADGDTDEAVVVVVVSRQAVSGGTLSPVSSPLLDSVAPQPGERVPLLSTSKFTGFSPTTATALVLAVAAHVMDMVGGAVQVDAPTGALFTLVAIPADLLSCVSPLMDAAALTLVDDPAAWLGANSVLSNAASLVSPTLAATLYAALPPRAFAWCTVLARGIAGMPLLAAAWCAWRKSRDLEHDYASVVESTVSI